MNAPQMLRSGTPAGRSASGRSRVLGGATAVVWLAGPAIAAYAFYVDDWRPLLALLALLLVDDFVVDKWIASDPGQIEREEREADELFTEEEAEAALSDVPDDANVLDDLIIALDHPELVNRYRYQFRGALVLRSVATVAEVVGWLLLLTAFPGQPPPLAALGGLLVIAASGGSVYRLTRVLTPRFRVRASDDERRRWLGRDKVVEYVGWGAVAVLVGYKLIVGDW